MIRILMIGTFLSTKTGTKGISEKLVESLCSDGFVFSCKSKKENKILRFCEIVHYCFFAKYDKIHIDTFSGNAFRIAEVASTIAKLRRRKIILTLHGGKLPEFYLQYPDRVKRVLNRAAHIQTPSKYLQTFFKRQDIELQYLPNSIDLSRFPYDRSSVVPHSLLWVRAFSEVYNPCLPILILSELRKTLPDSTLTMIGPDKGLLPRVKSLINEMNLKEFVTITGPVKNNELFKFYQAHEVFLNTTSYESFGVAVLEAAACGIPIVSTKVGEIPLIWKSNEDILLVDNTDTFNFVKQITRLFTDPELSNTLSSNARKNAEKYDWLLLKSNWIRLFS